ncbi:TatD family hydrolase [Stackebrandtia soli]|uniref:TatD family hydrolase n=1 Tax=Stackebrandtia soli TaxID=1892856 RepID=UPI0039E74080
MSKRTERAAKEQRPPVPSPLPVPIADSHCHLDIVAGWGWDTDRTSVVEPTHPDVARELDDAHAAGVARVVQVGIDVPSSEWAVALAEHDSRVVAAVALHPNDAPKLDDLDGALAEIEKLAQRPRVRALGETGMDYYRTDETGRAQQERSFRAHIAMAKQYDKTLVIHDRDAHDDVLRILAEEGAPDRVVLHCFSGDAVFARECGRRGYFMSFAGNVTFGNASMLREAVAVCPEELLLVETDAPFMAPVPWRGRKNGPFLVGETVRFLANHLDRDLESLCATVDANTTTAFGDW